MQRGAGPGEQLAAARQIEHVVGVAAVGEAAARGHQPAVAQLAQVIGDEVLSLGRQRTQLRDAPVAAGQLAQQPPAQRMARQLQKPRRGGLVGSGQGDHFTPGRYINSD